jgi:hypothetical protein
VPVIHIYTAERVLSPARKQLMIEKVTLAAAQAEGSSPPTEPASRISTFTCWGDEAGFVGATCAPFAASTRAKRSPSPLDAPVTTHTRSRTENRSATSIDVLTPARARGRPHDRP